MKHTFSLLALLLIVALPTTGYARHNDDDDNDNDRGWNIDRSDLDDDIVKKIPIPVLFGIDYSDITKDFGDPRGDGTRSHEGQDLFAIEGTPIVSPTEAIVIRTGKGESAGNFVYTANPGGETFRYMHLADIANLDEGDELEAGDYLGTVGDTGNAKGLPHHLHFEMRDEDNEAQDPYPRLKDEFTFKEKISFLAGIFKDIRNDNDYAEFLVETYPSEFKQALREGYKLPTPVVDALEAKGIVSEQTALAKLEALFAGLPKLLNTELKEGSQGPAVILLQMYLMYTTDGPARDALRLAGPTGYYGPVTSKVVSEYQTTFKLPVTGVYDAKTRSHMVERDNIELQIK